MFSYILHIAFRNFLEIESFYPTHLMQQGTSIHHIRIIILTRCKFVWLFICNQCFPKLWFIWLVYHHILEQRHQLVGHFVVKLDSSFSSLFTTAANLVNNVVELIHTFTSLMVTVFWHQSNGFAWSFRLNLTCVKLLPSIPAWIIAPIFSESSQFISSSPAIDMNSVKSEYRLESSNVNRFIVANQSLNLFQSVSSCVGLEGPKLMCSSLLLTEDPANSFIALFIGGQWFKNKAYRWRVPSCMLRLLVNPHV